MEWRSWDARWGVNSKPAPFAKHPPFGAGTDRCVVIEIAAHKNGPQGEKKLTAAQL